MLSVTCKSFMLSVIKLNVIMLSVMAPGAGEKEWLGQKFPVLQQLKTGTKRDWVKEKMENQTRGKIFQSNFSFVQYHFIYYRNISVLFKIAHT
jgi:hypothetical protein